MEKVTMQKIADEAGVSKCMVSLALSDKYGVNSETKAKIISVAVRLGYNFSDIRKKKKQAKAITILIQGKDMQSKRYWPQIFKGVVKKIKELDYVFYSETILPETDWNDLLVRITQHGTNGIISLNYFPDEWQEQIQKLKLPIVLVDSRNMSGAVFDQVRVNNSASSYEATRLLLENGHRNICFVGNREYSVSFNERYQGFNEAVLVYRDEINAHSISDYRGTEAFGRVLSGIGLKRDSTLEDELLFDAGELYRLLKNNGRGITAFICANDIVADIVHDMCLHLEYRVPDDISIIGFDNIMISDNTWINECLSSVAVPIFQMGERAVKLINERFLFPDDNLRETILLSASVIKKKSIKNMITDSNDKQELKV